LSQTVAIFFLALARGAIWRGVAHGGGIFRGINGNREYIYTYCREWESTSPSASFSRTSAAIFMRIIILKLKHAAVFMRIAQKVDGGALQGTASSDHTQMH